MLCAVLSDKPEKREAFCKSVGKETGKDDIAFYSFESGGKKNTIVEPTLFPQKIQPLAHVLYIADYVVILIDQLTPHVGEMIVALDMLKKDKGMLVTSLNLPIKGTVLERYEKVADENAAREKLLALQDSVSSEGELFALVDKYVNVKGTGNVALGVIKEGKMKKQEAVMYLPDKKEIEIRSIQVDGNDVDEVAAGEKFGIAFKGEPIDRGMLVSFRSEFESGKSIIGRFQQSQFYKDEIKHKLSFYYNFQFVEGSVIENSASLDKEILYRKRDPVIVLDPSNQKLRIVGSFTPI